ncbi:MAG: hypothetical protein HYV26_07755 [Candidatus Hydrogenedentes bacterium]|nr:hypothetical protein [Candidatus Hydrogenedentota bacterium]
MRQSFVFALSCVSLSAFLMACSDPPVFGRKPEVFVEYAPESLAETMTKTNQLVWARMVDIDLDVRKDLLEGPFTNEGYPVDYTAELEIIRSHPPLPDAYLTIKGHTHQESLQAKLDEAIFTLKRTPEGFTDTGMFHMFGVYRVDAATKTVQRVPDAGEELPVDGVWEMLCDTLDALDEKVKQEVVDKWMARLRSGDRTLTQLAETYFAVAHDGTVGGETAQDAAVCLEQLALASRGEKSRVVNGTLHALMKSYQRGESEVLFNLRKLASVDDPEFIKFLLEIDWNGRGTRTGMSAPEMQVLPRLVATRLPRAELVPKLLQTYETCPQPALLWALHACGARAEALHQALMVFQEPKTLRQPATYAALRDLPEMILFLGLTKSPEAYVIIQQYIEPEVLEERTKAFKKIMNQGPGR